MSAHPMKPDAMLDHPIDASRSWEDIRTFLSVAEEGSLNAAARALGLNHTTVGRRIHAMEERYGAEFFRRKGNAMELTQDGELAIGHARTMSDAAIRFSTSLRNATGRVEGQVRIASSEGLGTLWLMPNIARFSDDHPKLKLNWFIRNRIEGRLSVDFDVGLSWHRVEETRAVVSRLGSCHYSLFCSKDYVERNGVPASLQEIGRGRVLHFNGYEDNEGFGPWNKAVRKCSDVVRLENTVAAEGVLASGNVVTLMPDYCALFPNKPIVRLPTETGIVLSIWLTYHEDVRESARIRAVTAEIRRLFARDQAVWFP